MTLARRGAGPQIVLMPPPQRPPTTDAEYRVVHEPWPRWMLQLGLIKLVAWGVLMSGAVIALALVVLALVGLFK